MYITQQSQKHLQRNWKHEVAQFTFQGPFVMVDELLKMIAECHLQKPQTTSKMTLIIIMHFN